MNATIRRHARIAAFAGLFAVAAGSAAAQMSIRPWDFQPADRLGAAVVMQQNGQNGFGAGQVCGGPTESTTAIGNYICIILGDGATAIIDAGQDMIGDATATTTIQELIDRIAAAGN
jgi:hypothetical protein